MATFDLGRVTPLYKGDYSASASYELNDVVLYNGSLYWHVQATATVGILPTDTTVWKLAFADDGIRAEIRGYADDAQVSKTAAAQSASQASASASSAQASASQAALSAQSAQSAETGATASAQTASTKASESSVSALSAASSAQTATDKATLASQKAAAASESASLATAKASAAATSETNAAASAQTATAKASEAAASATSAQEYDESAQASAVNAQTAQTAAETAQTGAETAQGLAEDARDLAQQYAESIDPDNILSAYATDTASGAVVSFADGANDIPLKSLVVNIDPVQSGSGDPSPDNVRPISGWSVVNVGVSGKNLFDSNFSDYTKPYDYYIRPIKLESGKKYVIKAELVGTAVTGAVFGVTKKGDKYSEFVPYVVVASSGAAASLEFTADGTFTSPKLIVYASGQAKFDEVMSNYNITLEVKADQNPYEPYKGTFHTISLGQTVYGGTLDVVSGELVIDHKGIDMGNMNWVLQEGSGTQFNRFFASEISADVSRDNMDGMTMLDLISPIAKADKSPVYTKDKDNSMCVVSSSGALYVICSEYATAAEFKTAVTGMMLVYRLANSLTIQLTPHEVRSLLGYNNIWADTGDSSVEYRADTKMYIERLTEPDADMIADANIVSGSYFMVGNNLYKATANIASGASVIVGTNAVKVSLAQALNEINA